MSKYALSDSRLSVSIHCPFSSSSSNYRTYSRPTENTVYVNPKMALNKNTSMIHSAIVFHPLSDPIR